MNLSPIPSFVLGSLSGVAVYSLYLNEKEKNNQERIKKVVKKCMKEKDTLVKKYDEAIKQLHITKRELEITKKDLERQMQKNMPPTSPPLDKTWFLHLYDNQFVNPNIQIRANVILPEHNISIEKLALFSGNWRQPYKTKNKSFTDLVNDVHHEGNEDAQFPFVPNMTNTVYTVKSGSTIRFEFDVIDVSIGGDKSSQVIHRNILPFAFENSQDGSRGLFENDSFCQIYWYYMDDFDPKLPLNADELMTTYKDDAQWNIDIPSIIHTSNKEKITKWEQATKTANETIAVTFYKNPLRTNNDILCIQLAMKRCTKRYMRPNYDIIYMGDLHQYITLYVRVEK